jgi:hypothetical protein
VIPPGGPVDDAALDRLDLWTDGGTRDIFDSQVAAYHLAGSWLARKRPVAFFTSTSTLPGQDPADETQFSPSAIAWEDLPRSVFYRYGKIDPTPADIQSGSGQHTGTGAEAIARIESSMYFLGRAWPDAPREQFEPTGLDPADDLDACAQTGGCSFVFTSSGGRETPVHVSLPPGYGHRALQDQRYPVIVLLHGYGGDAEQLVPLSVVVDNWMNASADSIASRLPKAILVFADGRCRVSDAGVAECTRGTFFLDSVRPTGAQTETALMELLDWVDGHFRTMPPSDVEVVE